MERLRDQLLALAELKQAPETEASLCKAVLGVTGDAATLSHAFDLATSSLDTGGADCARLAAAAGWVFLQHGQYSELVLQQFVQQVFLPLAVAWHGTPAGRHQLAAAGELLATKQAWGLVLEVLQSAHGSLSAAAAQGNCSSGAPLPPAVACEAIALLVSAAAAAADSAAAPAAAPAAPTPVEAHAQAAASLESVLQLASGTLFDTACQLLQCSESSLRQAAFQQLLPALLQAAGAQESQQRQRCLQQLFQQCLDMVARPVVPRRLGLAVLLQYCSDWPWLQPPPADAAATTAASSDDDNARFWALVRECLIDPEPLNRKRAFRLLQLLLPKQAEGSQWGVLTTLYELLDEFVPHLVKATWPLVSGLVGREQGRCSCWLRLCTCALTRRCAAAVQISQLHAPAPQFVDADAATDLAKTTRRNLLAKGVQQQPQQQQQQQDVQAQGTPRPMAFCWISILWTQALTHPNLQVRDVRGCVAAGRR
jgi:hypothetical protein